MDDHQREINRAKQLYAGFTYGRLRVIADTPGMPVANKAAALELMHEAEQTVARQAARRANFAIAIAVLSLAATVVLKLLPTGPANVILSAPKDSPVPIVIQNRPPIAPLHSETPASRTPTP